jgi:hypothetical protein
MTEDELAELIKTPDWMPNDDEWLPGQKPPQNDRERKLVLRAVSVLVGKQTELLRKEMNRENI